MNISFYSDGLPSSGNFHANENRRRWQALIEKENAKRLAERMLTGQAVTLHPDIELLPEENQLL